MRGFTSARLLLFVRTLGGIVVVSLLLGVVACSGAYWSGGPCESRCFWVDLHSLCKTADSCTVDADGEPMDAACTPGECSITSMDQDTDKMTFVISISDALASAGAGRDLLLGGTYANAYAAWADSAPLVLLPYESKSFLFGDHRAWIPEGTTTLRIEVVNLEHREGSVFISVSDLACVEALTPCGL